MVEVVSTVARMMSAGEILRSGMEHGIVPSTAEVDRKGRASLRSGDLDVVVTVQRELDNSLLCLAFVGDAKLGPAMSNYGSLAVRLDPAEPDSIGWPSGSRLGDDHVEFLRVRIGELLGFVEDRADLAAILASESAVRRGGLKAWLLLSNYPARLVQALIIARDLGSDELVEVIRGRLRSGTRMLPDGQDLDIMATAKVWAKQYEKALGYAISL